MERDILREQSIEREWKKQKREIKALRKRVAELEATLREVYKEAGNYADGAPDSHYLAHEMARLEELAGRALPLKERIWKSSQVKSENGPRP